MHTSVHHKPAGTEACGAPSAKVKIGLRQSPSGLEIEAAKRWSCQHVSKYFQVLIIFALSHLARTVAHLSGIDFYLRCSTVQFLLFQLLHLYEYKSDDRERSQFCFVVCLRVPARPRLSPSGSGFWWFGSVMTGEREWPVPSGRWIQGRGDALFWSNDSYRAVTVS